MLKNERNKFVNLIQLSTHASAELKQKLKIVENEIEILRKESEGKDHALVKERFESEHTLKERDTLRHDTNKMNAVLVTKRSQEEQNVSEIAKLNTIINSAEAELIRMKRDVRTPLCSGRVRKWDGKGGRCALMLALVCCG